MRDGFLPGDKDKKTARAGRTAGLVLSVGLHAFLVYVLYHVKIPIRIMPIGPNVRDVLIIPQETIFLPGPIENYSQNFPPPDLFGLGPGKPEPRPPVQKQKTVGTERVPGNADGSETGLVPNNFLRDRLAPPLPSSNRSQGSQFELNSRFRDDEDGRLQIDLSAIPEHIEDAPLGFEKGIGGNRSFRKYIQPGSAVRRRSGGSALAGGAGGRGQKAKVSFPSPGYDISPWARKVIDLVQFNWAIPGIQNIMGKSEIRISVDIEKNGTFSRFEILSSADLKVLNTAAVNSLQLSLPLPPLPDDFPAPNLPALFVFTYND